MKGGKNILCLCITQKKEKKRSLVILVMSSHQATGNASRLPAVLLLTLLSFGKKKSPKTLLYNIKLYASLVCLFSSILNHLKLHMCCRES